LPLLYQGARALLFPQEEDFGITPVEAAASGKPTVAFGAGGARETVLEGVSGLFFARQTADSLLAALHRSEEHEWDAWQIRRHAEQFGRAVFLRRVEAIVHNQWDMFKQVRTS
jgi:glycosyltransferase involved in cell wall biosynthesis